MWIVTMDIGHADVVPDDASALVLVLAEGADDSAATVSRWERDGDGWTLVGGPIDARIGHRGVAWGRGLHPTQGGRQKREGDGRSPAGVFRLGDAFGYAAEAPAGSAWPYQVVGPRDLWIEDPALPGYNTHIEVPGDRALEPWERRSVMIQDDPVHSLKVFVGHNAPPDVVPAGGSGIFVHAWRGGGRYATTGCTAIPSSEVAALVRWLDPADSPVLALLTEADHARLAASWGLPSR